VPPIRQPAESLCGCLVVKSFGRQQFTSVEVDNRFHLKPSPTNVSASCTTSQGHLEARLPTAGSDEQTIPEADLVALPDSTVNVRFRGSDHQTVYDGFLRVLPEAWAASPLVAGEQKRFGLEELTALAEPIVTGLDILHFLVTEE
ncbi:unnamed protein product, partial [Protopolystoma xenopodis]